MNIYDFAGNLMEWTLEKSNQFEKPCTYRGGQAASYGSAIPVAHRAYSQISGKNSVISIRATFY